MFKTKAFTTKKLLAIIIAFGLLVACLFGIVFGTKQSASADTEYGDELSITNLRMTEYTITDAGPFKNRVDGLNWAVFPSLKELVANDFLYVTVTIKFTMKEIDDGYQDVYLYPSINAGRYDYLTKVRFEYGGSKLTKDWGDVYVKFKTLPLSDFVTNNELGLIIRYDAYGFGSDDWLNYNCRYTVGLSKKSIREYNCVEGNVVFDGTKYG